MGSGMNTEQAKEYAKTMTYSEAVSNVRYGKCIKYRKATMIKLRELAEIADRLDKADAPQTSGVVWMENDMPTPTSYSTSASTADTPQIEKTDRIPYDPLNEMNIKRMIEERLRQTETQKETQNLNNDTSQTDKTCDNCGTPRDKCVYCIEEDKMWTPQMDSEITRNSLRTDCTGCEFVGWYDTDFPCVNCIRKNKDYYTLE